MIAFFCRGIAVKCVHLMRPGHILQYYRCVCLCGVRLCVFARNGGATALVGKYWRKDDGRFGIYFLACICSEWLGALFTRCGGRGIECVLMHAMRAGDLLQHHRSVTAQGLRLPVEKQMSVLSGTISAKIVLYVGPERQ